MSGADWPLAIDGADFKPIPDAWLDRGIDGPDPEAGQGPRVFALSVGVVDAPRALRVRYSTPRSSQVIEREFASIKSDEGEANVGGLLPILIRWGVWPRSLVPAATSPDDIRRGAETRLLRERWGHRKGEVPSDSDVRDELRPDGGRRAARPDAGPTDYVPFGGADDREGEPIRPNPCTRCDRSMSDSWEGDLCPFCKDDLVCDECEFEPASGYGLKQHYAKSHPDVRIPEGLL